MHPRRFLVLVVTCLTSIGHLMCQISGTVTDESGQPLPFATIYIEGTTQGASSNEDGHYRLNTNKRGEVQLQCQYLGYKTVSKRVNLTEASVTVDFDMSVDSYVAPEVVLTANAEDPAYAIIRKAIARRKFHLEQKKELQSETYIKSRLDLNKVPELFLETIVEELEYYDVDSSGQGIVYLSESQSTYYRRDASTWKEVMKSSRVSGFDNDYSFNTARAMDFSIYENLLPLGQAVVSPIANNALAHYRYELLGTTFDAADRLVNVIRVSPRNNGSSAAKGVIHVLEDKWSVPRAELTIAGLHIKNQFLDSLAFTFEAVEAAPDLWIDLQKNIYTTIKVFGFEAAIDYHGVFTDYVINPDWPDNFFGRELIVIQDSANQLSNDYWDTIRPIRLTELESVNYERMDSLSTERDAYQDSIVRNAKPLAPLDIFSGYSRYFGAGKLRYTYGLSSDQLFNTVQGFALGMNHILETNADSFHRPQWRLLTNLNYGFSEKRVRGSLGYQRGHTDPFKLRWGGEIGRHIVQYRQVPPLDAVANMVYSLLQEDNYAKFYETDVVAAELDQRLRSGFRLRGYAAYERRRALQNHSDHSWAKAEDAYESNNPLLPGDDAPAFLTNDRTLLGVQVGYVFKQRFIKHPHQTIILPSSLPRLTLDAQWSNNLETDEQFVHAQIDVTDDYNLGLWGAGSWALSAGTFFMDSPQFFSDFKHFDGNQTSYVYGPDVSRSFLAMDYYSLSTNDSYAELHAKHSFEGYLMRRIPVMRSFGWHTAVGVNALYTDVVEPYSELYAGIENIGIKFFRPLSAYVVWSFHEDEHISTDFVLGITLGNRVKRSPRTIATQF